MKTNKMNVNALPLKSRLPGILAAVLAVFMACSTSLAAVNQKAFSSPEEAVKALMAAGKNNDMKELAAILGPGSKDVLYSGDEVADRQGRELFKKEYDEKNSLSIKGNTAVLVIGDDEWPFPIPIVKKAGAWYFDTAKGKVEILDRRIGRNELNTIQAMLAVVDAQREYAMESRSRGIPEYAQKFKSDPGKKDGLYWPVREGEKPSPLGLLVAGAVEKGYRAKKQGSGPVPYQGYYYRMLKAQGRHASGGAYNYMVNGRMIGGFAVVAYPARYGNTGVMSFLVNHEGVVYQKDLGNNTKSVAERIAMFDPDDTWQKIKTAEK